MLSKAAKITLIIAGFLLTLKIVSNIVDVDLGWHLRFGADALNGRFQYEDTYTWTYYGKPWTNHEWLSDLIFWLIYSNFGYFSLAVVVSASIWGAFLLMQKIFLDKLTLAAIALSLIGVWSLDFILAVRPALLTLFFVPLIILTLQALPKKNLLFCWPAIFWLWSALHGSWLLGFIIASIYIAGNILRFILVRFLPRFAGKETGWSPKTIYAVIIWLAASALAILINPYGAKIYEEILAYFQATYFKTIISEWIPSYAYPVYIFPLILGSMAAIFLCVGWIKKKATIPEILLFSAFFFAAWTYKRNNLYMVLISLPAISAALKFAGEKILSAYPAKNNIIALTGRTALLLAGLVISLAVTPKIFAGEDIWNNEAMMKQRPYPKAAVDFLRKELADKNSAVIFNEFRWGGYLNWNLPQALVFLDGRGTVTWKSGGNESLLQKYREIKYEANGLKYLDTSPADYVLLGRDAGINTKPDFINKILFSNKDLIGLRSSADSHLAQMLGRSDGWRLIYEDDIARLWKKK